MTLVLQDNVNNSILRVLAVYSGRRRPFRKVEVKFVSELLPTENGSFYKDVDKWYITDSQQWSGVRTRQFLCLPPFGR